MQEISTTIRSLATDDDNLDLFEGQYPLTKGISYNSYLILAPDGAAIIDTVDCRRCNQWLDMIADALTPAATPLRYLIVQHVEPDHSGSIRALIERYPDLKIICSPKAAAMLADYFEDVDFASGRCLTVTDGQTLTVCGHSLRFIAAPMVHWPEVIMTLDETDSVLFSADAFGSFALADDLDSAWDSEARRYYANIVGKFGQSVQAVMKKLRPLTFHTVAPLHGPVLTDNLAHYWTLYDKWSRYEPETRGVLVAYASIHGGTADAARRLASMLRRRGAGEVVLLDLCRHHASYAVAEAFRLSSLALCSVTYDGELFPPMYDFIHHLAAKRLRNRRVGLIENGSWAPVAARLMTEMLSKMTGIEILSPTVTLRSRMHSADLPALTALADALSQ